MLKKSSALGEQAAQPNLAPMASLSVEGAPYVASPHPLRQLYLGESHLWGPPSAAFPPNKGPLVAPNPTCPGIRDWKIASRLRPGASVPKTPGPGQAASCLSAWSNQGWMALITPLLENWEVPVWSVPVLGCVSTG